jgi:trk system potassium uptake protein TrkA
MKMIVAGGGAVGKSIARNMTTDKNNQITIVDIERAEDQKNPIQNAEWISGDICDITVFEKAGGKSADLFVAATGDDQTNLVASMIAKTEFCIPKTIARVNHPKNEELFSSVWGVDYAVSTPKIMSRFIEEAAVVDQPIHIYEFAKSGSKLMKYKIGDKSPDVGTKLEDFKKASKLILCAITRGNLTFPPSENIIIEAGDEIIFLVNN